MSDDTIKLDADATSLLRNLRKAVESWGKYGDAIERVEKISLISASKNDALVRTINAVDEAGKKIVITQQKIGDQYEVTNVAVAKNIKMLEREAEAAAKAAEKTKALASAKRAEIELNARAKETIQKVVTPRGSDALYRGRKDSATQSEQLAYIRASEALSDLVRKHGISIKKINSFWKDAENGTLRRYTSAIDRNLRSAVMNVVSAEAQLGNETRKTNAAKEKQLRREKEVRDAIDESFRAEKRKREEAERALQIAKEQEKSEERKVYETLKRRMYPAYARARGKANNIGSAEEVAAYTRAMEKLEVHVKKHKIGLKAFDRIWGDVLGGHFRKYSDSMSKDLREKIIAVVNAEKKIGKAMKSAEVARLKAIADEKRLQEAAKHTLLTWKGIVRLMVGSAIRRAMFAVASGIQEGVREAVKLQIKLAEIQTISQEAQQTTEEWRQGVLALSNAYGLDIKDQIEGTYQTLSNQIAKGAETIAFMADANDLATASVSSTSDAVNLLSSAINAYGADVTDAEEISAKLFKTVELGRVRVSQIANSFGDVAVLAHQAGLSMDELLAALALMTRQGIKPSKAMTQLRGIILKILKPTKAMTKAVSDWGYTSASSVVKAEGFLSFLERIDKITKGNAEEIAKFVPRIRGMSGQMVLSGKGLQNYAKDLDAVSNSMKSYSSALNIVYNNSGKQSEVAANRVKNFFKSMGNTIVEGINDILNYWGDFDNAMDAERAALQQTDAVKKAVQSHLKILKAADTKERNLMAQITAAKNKSIRQQVLATAEGYKKINDIAKDSSKVIIKHFSDGVSALRSSIQKAGNDITKIQDYISKSASNERDKLFQWAQETRSSVQQFHALTGKILDVTARLRTAAQMGKTDDFFRLKNQQIKYIEDQRKLSLQIKKDNKQNAGERVKLEKQIQDELLKIRLRGNLPTLEEQRNIEELIKAYKKISDGKIQDIHYASVLVSINKTNIELAKKMSKVLEDRRKKEKEALVTQELNLARLKDIVKTVENFKGTDVALGDPVKGLEAIKEQEKALNRLVRIAKEMGVSTEAILGRGTIEALRQANEQYGKMLLSRKMLQDKQNNVGLKEDSMKRFEEAAKREERLQTIIKKRDALFAKLRDIDILLDPKNGEEYKKLIKDYTEAVKALDFRKVAELTPLLESYMERGTSFSNIAGADKWKELLDAYQKTDIGTIMFQLRNESKEAGNNFKDIDTETKSINDRVQTLETTLERTNQGALEDTLRRTWEIDKLWQNIIDNINDANKPEVKAPKEFATGKTSLGSDNVPAMLNGNEMVVNARNSQRFYSQLVAMNAQPAAMHSNNFSMGDVNVTMEAPSGNTQIDALGIARQVQRYIRRGIA